MFRLIVADRNHQLIPSRRNNLVVSDFHPTGDCFGRDNAALAMTGKEL